MRVVRPSEWIAMPWRNGGGVTHEVARDGAGAEFSWRVSVADIGGAGPFSAFPGFDRWLGLLDGESLSLSIATPGVPGRRDVRLDRPGLPFAFRGEDDVRCSGVGGPTRDLNVMVARERWRADVRRVAVAAGGAVVARGELAIAFALGEGLRAAGVHLGPRDCVVGAGAVELVADAAAEAWVVALVGR